ncbi:MAG TPA: radical SAM protein [Candidatus Nanoarchaeia archaeon]|nr:radical SAM protein [Candidatus Nanoarchaeia archaeon]
MKILLINPPLEHQARWDVSQIAYPPLGILWIAAMLEKEGHHVKFLDGDCWKFDILEEIKNYNPRLVGLAVITIKVNSAAAMIHQIKEVYPQLPVVVGGNHITNVKQQSFDQIPGADYLMIGEAYYTFPELAHALEQNTNLSTIRGLIWKEDGNIITNKSRPDIQDLDILPFPARHLLPQPFTTHYQSDTRYLRKPSTSMITSLGCYYRCTFCDHTRNVRFFSPKRVVDEIEHLQKIYGIKEIHFWDEIFTMTPKRTREICQEIIDRNIDITWSGYGRLDIIARNPDLVPLIKKSGCWFMSFGVESGSQKVRDFIKKDLTDEQIRQAAETLAAAGIYTRGLFMLGHPTETLETLEQTIQFAKTLPLNSAQFNLNIPLPGTEQYANAKDYGILDEERFKDYSGHGKPIYIPNGLTAEILEEAQKRAYKEFFARPQVFFRNARFVLRSPDSIKKYSKKFVTIMTGGKL